jgi:Bacterial PH domain
MSSRRERKRLRGVDVQKGESVLMVGRPSLAVVWPKYVLTLGLYGLWRKRNVSVLTDRRVVVGKGIFSRTEYSIPIKQISDAMYVRRGLSAYCEVASVLRGRDHVERLGPLSARQARRLTDEIESRH